MASLNLSMQLINRSLLSPTTNLLACVRNASKKVSASAKNPPLNIKPKHRGWKRQDGHEVKKGTLLLTQNKLRFLPGLNVGFGRNGTLFALEDGKVVITCERVRPKMDHSWIQKRFGGYSKNLIYKKYFNVIAEPQHNRFKLVDLV